MDTITVIALSIDNPIIKTVGMLLESSLIYGGLILALLLLGERRNEKRVKILLSLIIAGLAATAIKALIAEARPCAGESWCPEGYSFPSMHAVLAFTLMTGFFNKKSYAFYLFFALFVSFTRLNLGVHIFQDVAGALPVALISYYITDKLWRMYVGETPLKRGNEDEKRD